MASQQLMDSIAYCGLICHLCFRAHECSGCKAPINLCEHNCADEGCFQKLCCEQNGYTGCWECAQLRHCTEGIYQLGEMSKIKAFAICIQEDGLAAFAKYVLRNERAGLSVEKDRDYDGLPIFEVLNLLRLGNSP
ncbi:MAG: DUF3795 domain-containing protein [Anaerolineaceae bacterium]|nr:DUF3795 domain-containing protein [Anaerolineaceae bacterium]